MSPFSPYFSSFDYTLSLPMVLLTLFALGVLIIDLMLPDEWKRLNAVTAELGIVFSAFAQSKFEAGFCHSPEKVCFDESRFFFGKKRII